MIPIFSFLTDQKKLISLESPIIFFLPFETLGKFGGSFKGEILHSQQDHFELPSL